MSQYAIHKRAKEILREVAANPNQYLIIHYSCESFLDKQNGGTPRITTIAIRYLESAQTRTFSIHEIAEQKKVEMDDIESKYNSLEMEMLTQYFEFVRQHQQYYWIHWNMRDTNYGFYAIENRFTVLGGVPTSIPDERKVDLSRILVNCYGRGYIGHPRLEKIVDKNMMTKKDFLNGQEEANAFENKQYIKLRNSTLRKIDLFSCIISAAANNVLKTDSNWKERYGIGIQSAYEALKEKWWFNLATFLLGTVLGVALGAIVG